MKPLKEPFITKTLYIDLRDKKKDELRATFVSGFRSYSLSPSYAESLQNSNKKVHISLPAELSLGDCTILKQIINASNNNLTLSCQSPSGDITQIVTEENKKEFVNNLERYTNQASFSVLRSSFLLKDFFNNPLPDTIIVDLRQNRREQIDILAKTFCSTAEIFYNSLFASDGRKKIPAIAPLDQSKKYTIFLGPKSSAPSLDSYTYEVMLLEIIEKSKESNNLTIIGPSGERLLEPGDSLNGITEYLKSPAHEHHKFPILNASLESEIMLDLLFLDQDKYKLHDIAHWNNVQKHRWEFSSLENSIIFDNKLSIHEFTSFDQFAYLEREKTKVKRLVLRNRMTDEQVRNLIEKLKSPSFSDIEIVDSIDISHQSGLEGYVTITQKDLIQRLQDLLAMNEKLESTDPKISIKLNLKYLDLSKIPEQKNLSAGFLLVLNDIFSRQKNVILPQWIKESHIAQMKGLSNYDNIENLTIKEYIPGIRKSLPQNLKNLAYECSNDNIKNLTNKKYTPSFQESLTPTLKTLVYKSDFILIPSSLESFKLINTSFDGISTDGIPNLRKLHIEKCNCPQLIESLLQLTSLEELNIDYKIDAAELQELLLKLPNLKKISVTPKEPNMLPCGIVPEGLEINFKLNGEGSVAEHNQLIESIDMEENRKFVKAQKVKRAEFGERIKMLQKARSEGWKTDSEKREEIFIQRMRELITNPGALEHYVARYQYDIIELKKYGLGVEKLIKGYGQAVCIAKVLVKHIEKDIRNRDVGLSSDILETLDALKKEMIFEPIILSPHYVEISVDSKIVDTCVSQINKNKDLKSIKISCGDRCQYGELLSSFFEEVTKHPSVENIVLSGFILKQKLLSDILVMVQKNPRIKNLTLGENEDCRNLYRETFVKIQECLARNCRDIAPPSYEEARNQKLLIDGTKKFLQEREISKLPTDDPRMKSAPQWMKSALNKIQAGEFGYNDAVSVVMGLQESRSKKEPQISPKSSPQELSGVFKALAAQIDAPKSKTASRETISPLLLSLLPIAPTGDVVINTEIALKPTQVRVAETS